MRTNRWFILAIIFLARMSMAFQFQSIASVAPLLMKDFEIEYAAIGWLIGLYQLSGIALALPGGMLGKRFGDKRLVLFGLILMTGASVLVSFSKSYSSAALGRTLGGTGGVLINVLMAKMVADWFAKKEIITAMAILVNSWPAGIGLGLLTQPALGVSEGWPIVFQVSAAASGLGFVLMTLFYQAPDANEKSDAKVQAMSYFSAGETWLVGQSGVIWALYNVAYIIVFSFGAPLLVSRDMAFTEAAALISLNTWLMIVSIPVGGWLTEKFRFPNGCMVGGFILFGMTMIFLPFGPVLFLILIMGMIGGIPAGPIMSLPAGVLKPENRAVGMGLFYTVTYAGMAILPAVAGWLLDITGKAATSFFFGAGLLFCCIFILKMFHVSQKRFLKLNP
jgi:predicted MFS family arabinose efflux permease